MALNYNDILNKPVQYVKGVGPKRAAALQKLNIFTAGDLLYHFPRSYQDRTKILPVHSYGDGQVATVLGRVLHAQEIKPRRGLTIVKLAIDDGHGVFYAVWFNQKYVIKQYPPGTTLLLTGKVDRRFGGKVQLQVLDSEIADEPEQAVHGGRIVPVYALTEGISQKIMRTIIHKALEQTTQLQEYIPLTILEKYRLPALVKSLRDIHFPEDDKGVHQARRRFIFEELFLFQLALAQKRQGLKRIPKSHSYSQGEGPLVKKFLKNLPFEPTADQIKVWGEIMQDLDSPYPMNRLLQGDVGAGKTLISALVLIKAAEGGLQGAMMAPTEILAEQHYMGLSKWLTDLGISVEILTSSTKKAKREEILAGLSRGDIQVLLGTHALIQEVVEFKNLGAVVVDEQHRFGVKQRQALQYKGKLPDMLVMTATPIPRSLALTVYGDLDLSVIYSLPPGRKPIKTYHVTHRALPEVYRLIIKEVQQGRQAYIVCPLVEESDSLDVQSAVDLAEELSQGPLRHLSLGLMHGRLSADEKEAVMDRFRAGSIDVLVSTTVIEVGVDVPNATVMVVIDADRFGLAQLHQLRGRVGRGSQRSYCVLVSNPKTEEGRQRMAAMVNTSDGFALAEEDLRLRGPGEFFGIKQSGLPDFKIADLIRDRQAMECARQEANHLVRHDPHLTMPQHQLLNRQMQHRFSKKAFHST
ncbi:ATP-dependent DNA helicase RecG [Desulfofalx alkaliphila]|uniref:ATP-dependent DNA helicase RecG n=1 Tax=Desulfofalx alkaliphila TaxID=105483 RepID=UPI0004E23350|nr:ATP-dependent DNA helicase RecG [Desulfofalx alkaliphila]